MVEEKVYIDFYNVLISLNYPYLTTVRPNDTKKLLKGENRLKLLSWIVNLYPVFRQESSEQNTPDLKDQLVKNFAQLGLNIDVKVLLEDGSTKDHFRFLKSLIPLMKTLSHLNNLPDTTNTTRKNVVDIYTDFIQANESSKMNSSENQIFGGFIEKNELVHNHEIQNNLNTIDMKAKDKIVDCQAVSEVLNKYSQAFNPIVSTFTENSDDIELHRKQINENISDSCNKFIPLDKIMQQHVKLQDNIQNEKTDYESITENLQRFDELIEISVLETSKICNAQKEL